MVGRVTASQIAFGISRVGLAPLHIRFDVGGRHQPHRMPESRNLARPEMRRATGLYPDQARRHALKELQNLASPQLPTDQDLSIRGNSMDLENILRLVQIDRHHLSHGRPF